MDRRLTHNRSRALKTTSKYPSEFPKCDAHGNKQFLDALSKASNGCTSTSSYKWSGSANPTDAQREDICKCDIKPFDVPMCSWLKEGKYNTSIATHVDYMYDCESINGKERPQMTEVPVVVTAITDDDLEGSASSSHVGIIAGSAGGVLAVILIIGFILWKRRRNGQGKPRNNEANDRDAMRSPATSYLPFSATSPNAKGGNDVDPQPSVSTCATYTTIVTTDDSVAARGSRGSGGAQGNRGSGGVRGSRGTGNKKRYTQGGKWDDPVILAARIPRDAIFFGPLISRGAFGEVFRGTYRGKTVAIKQLRPARSKDLKQIDEFLGEAKFMSLLEHDRIVTFIGVAWNSLSDACMVVEYMENGDLRSVLERSNAGADLWSIGFDTNKVKIALHVAHALTYLHSMQPMVLHRDLKSKNILLDANLDAKVTDFGISRERTESTMTAGVGSSLWMAPEVMMGERYNEKADVFSFGVVLSELDTHQLPYFHARLAERGSKISETAIMQQVMLGRLSVCFSAQADPEVVQLGRACVDLNAKARPTAAQVFHRVTQLAQRWRRDSALI